MYGKIDIKEIGAVFFEIKKNTDEPFTENVGTNLRIMKLENYSIVTFGRNNRLPDEMKKLIDDNHLLPGLLDKQAKLLLAQMPFLYRYKIDNGKRIRVPAEDRTDIQRWLNSWKENNLKDDYITYLIKRIKDFYADGNGFSKFRFKKNRRLANPENPVLGLEHIRTQRARKATTKEILTQDDIEDSELEYIMVGNWNSPTSLNLKAYPRFNEAKPFAHPVAVSHTYDYSYGEEFYSYPTLWGIRNVIKASNRNYNYLNSYYENALSAKYHFIIPDAYVLMKRNIMQEICERNRTFFENGETDKQITEYMGIAMGIEFKEQMILDLIKIQTQKMIEVLKGEDNQGGIFVSRKLIDESTGQSHTFEIAPIDSRYKDYVDSLLSVIKQSNSDLITGIGLDPTISGITNDGVISRSGSDVLNNFIIYQWSLNLAEFFVMKDINKAIKLNFFRDNPDQDVYLGFYRDLPQLDKQQNINEKDRLINTQLD